MLWGKHILCMAMVGVCWCLLASPATAVPYDCTGQTVKAPFIHRDTLQTPGGITLRYQIATPADDSPKTTVLLLHGRTEFIEKYDEVTGCLINAGHQVITFDWRGQGKSTRLLDNPHKGHVKSFEDYLTDLETIMAEVIRPQRAAGQPLIMLSHSTGGNVGMRRLFAGDTDFTGAVFVSPMWKLKMNGAMRFFLSVLTSLAQFLGFEEAYLPGAGDYERIEFEGNDLTSSPERLARNQDMVAANPSLALGGPTLAWLAAAQDSIKILEMNSQHKSLEIPILVIASSQETVIDSGTAQRTCAHLQNCIFMDVGGEHEILQEKDKVFRTTIQSILEFLDNIAESNESS